MPLQQDLDQYKNRLSDYLDHKGIFKKKNRYRCVKHRPDEHPSATIYENGGDNTFNCNSCGFKGDIFDCAGALIGKEGKDNFKDQLEEVQSVFGGKTTPVIVQNKNKNVQNISNNVQKTSKNVQVIPLEHKTALQKFSTETVLNLCSGIYNGFGDKAISEDSKDYREFKDVSWFPYYNENKFIDLMVVRFEDQHSKKEVLTFYWNGKNVAMKNYPVRIYGRYSLSEFLDKPVLIHEGEKCCSIASKPLLEFIHITWNGGGKKFYKPDWSILKKSPGVFLLPDDDEPGIKTMHGLKLKLNSEYGIPSITIPIFEKVRKIKSKGADIEEILQCYSPDEITKTILDLRENDGDIQRTAGKNNDENKNSEADRNNSGNTSVVSTDTSNRSDNRGKLGITKDGVFTGEQSNNGDTEYPFKILGIADDGRAYFLNYENRLLCYDLESLTEKKLMNLAGLTFFKAMGVKKKDDWDQEIDAIMRISNRLDFDMEKIRGRGAWKDSEGNICYHDGKTTTGKFDKDWTFIRKPKKQIGIFSEHCESDTRKQIMETCKLFSFSTPADCIRLLSWAVLAPFSGALTWRPAFLLTGESGTGKSTLIDNIVRKISLSLAVNGGSTTEAAIRQYCGTDSGSTIVDEAESKSMRDRERVEGQFSLMRASTTDDSPKTLKGSVSGVATPFEMRQMFGFVAVNASVDNVADDNRIIRINLKQTNNYLLYVESLEKIKKLLTIKNCEGIRAFTWSNLKKIITLSERLEFIIQNATGQSPRYAAGESILLAANLVAWENQTDGLDNPFLHEYIKNFYSGQTQEDSRDETEEMIVKILDHTTLVEVYSQGKISMSFRELLYEMKKYLDEKLHRDLADLKSGHKSDDPVFLTSKLHNPENVHIKSHCRSTCKFSTSSK